MKKRVTIYDLAKKLNISASTVSRVLNNSTHPVKQEIRDLVLSTAKAMNYYPNIQARNLKNNSSLNIGVVLPFIDNPFYPSIVRGIEDEAIKHGYSIMVCSCDRLPERTDRYIQSLAEQNVKGIIAIYIDHIPASLLNFIKHGGRVVTVNSSEEILSNAYNVLLDTGYESYIATKYLLELGHRKIALLIGQCDTSIRTRRIEGYKRALYDFKAEFVQDYICICNDEMKNFYGPTDCDIGVRMAEKMINKVPEVTGVVCMNDMVALGCISLLKKKNKKVPEDYSVIGMDDAFFSSLIDPELTTIRVDKYKFGQKLMHFFLEMLSSDIGDKFYDYTNEVSLVTRKSTAPYRQRIDTD